MGLRRFCFVLAFLVSISILGCEREPSSNKESNGDVIEIYQEGDELIIKNGRWEAVFHLDRASLDLFGKDRSIVLKEASAAYKSSNDLISAKGARCSWEAKDYENSIGAGKLVSINCAKDDGEFITRIEVYPLVGYFIYQVGVKNLKDKILNIKQILPLKTDETSGGLFWGNDKNSLRLLSNGSGKLLDFYADLSPATKDVESNWNLCIYDQNTKRALIIGFLTFEKSVPIVSLKTIDKYPARSDDAVGFAMFELKCDVYPEKNLQKDETFLADVVYIEAFSDNAFDALEGYAKTIHEYQGFKTWFERYPDAPQPSGWNSWSGGSGSGGYGTDIDENLIVENLKFMTENFKPFGMSYFQVDDGWQITEGDWQTNEKFPSGMDYIAERANEAGLIAGIWIAPFVVKRTSSIYLEHPDWIAPKDPFGEVFIPSEWEILDLSNPEVLKWIEETFAQIRSWGYRWIKVDFAYWALLAEELFDYSITREEAYRNALQAIRKGIGDDSFFLHVSIMGLTYGLVDSNRISLDNMPYWDPKDGSYTMSSQGFKATAKTVARRYWLHDNIWITHPDLIFFRDHPDPDIGPLTLDESKAFLTLVAMSGGIVKLGERLIEMQKDWVNATRVILPSFGKSARPLDLFEREFAEKWWLKIENAPDGRYDVLSIINWGLNWDLTKLPYEEMADSARDYKVSLKEIGLDDGDYLLFEFWTQKYLGKVSDDINISVPAHASRVIAIRKNLNRPQLLGTNRHILMGAVDIEKSIWDEPKKELKLEFEAPMGSDFAPFVHEITIFAPDSYKYKATNLVLPQDYELKSFNVQTKQVEGGKTIKVSFEIKPKRKKGMAENPPVSLYFSF